KQHLTISRVTIILLTFIGVVGGIFLSNPLNVQAQNYELPSPMGIYTLNQGDWGSETYADLLRQRPADFPTPKTLWNSSAYRMNYEAQNGTSNPSNFLRHQIFISPLVNGLPPKTVKYYSPKDQKLNYSNW